VAQPILQVDAFTHVKYRGNPAAICVLAREAEPRWMQDVAREMNLSETAFLVHRRDHAWDLRWFTPAVEVDLCGHATLAAAHALWAEGYQPAESKLHFHTRSGVLIAARDEPWIEIDMPALPAASVDPPPELLSALGLHGVAWVGRSRMDLLVRMEDEAEVRGIAPDMTRLRNVDARGVMVTAPSSSGDYDFVSRFFAPRVGVDEDPVTGSAHCCLAPYWARELGRRELLGFQASARGGVVRVKVRDDRVLLGGQCVTVLRGELL
jgi:PhzF family phenazine biosynthesis protein